jgi:hypothetical protein
MSRVYKRRTRLFMWSVVITTNGTNGHELVV